MLYIGILVYMVHIEILLPFRRICQGMCACFLNQMFSYACILNLDFGYGYSIFCREIVRYSDVDEQLTYSDLDKVMGQSPPQLSTGTRSQVLKRVGYMKESKILNKRDQ